MPNATNCGASPVLALELDRNGNVSKKTMKLDREAQLTNSLLQWLYPGIRVATVDVPSGAVWIHASRPWSSKRSPESRLMAFVTA